MLNQSTKALMIASATFRTTLKVSLLCGFGLRQRHFSSPSALSNALICSGSSPSRLRMDLSWSIQNCKFLSLFLSSSFSGKCRCRKGSYRERMD